MKKHASQAASPRAHCCARVHDWLATIPSKGFFTGYRLSGPKQTFFDKTWKPNDIEKVK